MAATLHYLFSNTVNIGDAVHGRVMERQAREAAEEQLRLEKQM